MRTARRLNPLDWMFLAGETREAPMHVGALLLLKPPRKPPADFLRDMMDEVRNETTVHSPWNLKLRYPGMPAHPLQAWVEERDFDVEYHVRRSALPAPGDERELGVLVSRLHSHRVDFRRPPWEVHFIEGLERGRIAIYIKVHHALVDGYTGIRLLARSFSTSPRDRHTPLFFARPAPLRKNTDSAPAIEIPSRVACEPIDPGRGVGPALRRLLRPRDEDGNALVRPMQAPKSVLNGPIGRNRRFATQQFSIPRLKRITKAHGGTLNDLVLALCGDALRRLLLELDALPGESLTAMLPVNIRPRNDPGGGNAVGAILASLGTDIAGPVERLRTVIASTKQAKAQLSGMSRNGILQFSTLLMAPALLTLLPGAAGRLRPAFNLVISNVPGPDKPLYFRGWKLEAYYPVSIPFRGCGLNITAVGYVDTLNFGFVGCRDTLPHLQRLAVYSREALEALETATSCSEEPGEAPLTPPCGT